MNLFGVTIPISKVCVLLYLTNTFFCTLFPVTFCTLDKKCFYHSLSDFPGISYMLEKPWLYIASPCFL